jgi:hypothetical protein
MSAAHLVLFRTVRCTVSCETKTDGNRRECSHGTRDLVMRFGGRLLLLRQRLQSLWGLTDLQNVTLRETFALQVPSGGLEAKKVPFNTGDSSIDEVN